MSAFCYESHPLNLGAIKRFPAMAMDAAPAMNGELIGDDTMTKLLELLRPVLDEATFAKVRDVIISNSKMAADDEPAPAKRPMTAAGFERGVDFLRSRNISEDDINTARNMLGFKKPSVAEDSA
jgi:hypothetical protein